MNYSLVADLYDTYARINFDLPFFLKEARQVSGEIFELMAGTGRVSIPLAESGARLTCVDSAPEMLAVLQAKLEAQGLSAELHKMDVGDLALGRLFDLILLPFHSFAELQTPAQQQKALERIHQHLSATGVFICTLHNPAVRLKRADGQLRLWGSFARRDRPGKLLLWGLERYDPGSARVEGVQFFEEYDEQGMLESKRMVEIRFAVIEKEQFERLAAAAGLKISALYGDYDYAPFQEAESSFMIWKLQKQDGSPAFRTNEG